MKDRYILGIGYPYFWWDHRSVSIDKPRERGGSWKSIEIDGKIPLDALRKHFKWKLVLEPIKSKEKK